MAASDRGTGQGSVISPLFANIYLHYVLDLWANRWRRREATGDMIIVRYADDVVAGFEHEDDARRFLDAMRARFKEFALSLHPDKTRLIEFGRHTAVGREKRGLGKPETFNFLGFTFICGKSRKGNFLLHRKSRGDRMRAKLQEIQEELRRRRHQAIPLQGEWLRSVVSGYFNYHAVPTNGRALTVFHYHVRRLWLRTLQRRSERDGSTWQRIEKLARPLYVAACSARTISHRAARKAVSLMRPFGQRTCAVDMAPLLRAPRFMLDGIQGRGLPLIPCTR